MKITALLFAVLAAVAVIAAQFGKPVYISADENTRLLWLTYQKVMQEAMYEMDMHWSYRLALAEKMGDLDEQLLSEAPRTLGDGLPWPEHFMKRANSKNAERAKAKEAFDAYARALREKYKAKLLVFENETGKVYIQ